MHFKTKEILAGLVVSLALILVRKIRGRGPFLLVSLGISRRRCSAPAGHDVRRPSCYPSCARVPYVSPCPSGRDTDPGHSCGGRTGTGWQGGRGSEGTEGIRGDGRAAVGGDGRDPRGWGDTVGGDGRGRDAVAPPTRARRLAPPGGPAALWRGRGGAGHVTALS